MVRRTCRAVLVLAVLSGSGGVGATAQDLRSPAGISVAPDGSLVVADRGAHRIYRIDPASGDIAVVAGTGEAGFAGDGGPAVDASFRNPEWVAFDAGGDLWIADRGNARVRVVDAASGRVDTRVGGDAPPYSGDGGAAVAAGLTAPFGLAVAPDGRVYVFDTEAHAIRRLDPADGTLRTVVGNGEAGHNGDGPGTTVQLRRPHNGTFDARGRLVFGDSFNHLIRTFDPASNAVATLAGTGTRGLPETGGTAAAAELNYFGGIVVESDGSVVFSSILDHRIWRIRAVSGTLEPIAGTGVEGHSGDGGPALSARLSGPYGLALDDGVLYVADAGNRAIRAVDLRTGTIRTVTRAP